LKTLPVIATLFLLVACREVSHSPHVLAIDSIKKHRVAVDGSHDTTNRQNDSIARLETDDFPVDVDMLANDRQGPAWNIKSGPIHASDQIWYTNDSLQQTLIFDLYTDYHRYQITLFSNRDIPRLLLNNIWLVNTGGDSATLSQKAQHFKGFIKAARKIDRSYFTSLKGLQIGDNRRRLLSLYGKPDKMEETAGVKCYRWDYEGDELYDGQDLRGKPLAKDSFGYHVMALFRNDRLIALIINNDIP
jgi:hypothetical protein